MLIENQSKLFFLLGCIPMRIGIALLPMYLDKQWLSYFGLILLAISLGLFYLYFTNQRLDADEAGGVTWWSKYRILHGSLYMSAAVYAFMKSSRASIPLFADVVIGMGLFLDQHYIQ